MISQFFEVGDNKLALTVTFLLLLLIIILIVSMFSKSVEKYLHALHILEDKESPRELLIYIFAIVFIIRLIHVLLIQPFVVDGESMYPDLKNSDVLLVNKIGYKIDKPQVGDIIVFKYHDKYHKCIDEIMLSSTYKNSSSASADIKCANMQKDPYDNKYLVKRIVGVPNSIVTYEGHEYSAGADQYTVMGDNRAESYDSRSWGPLDGRYISGKVFLRLLPINTFGFDPAPMSDALNLVK